MKIYAVLFQHVLNEMGLLVHLHTVLVRLHSNTTYETTMQFSVLFILPAPWMVGLITLRPDLKFVIFSTKVEKNLDVFLYLCIIEMLLKLYIVPGEKLLACRIFQYQDVCLRLNSCVQLSVH